NSGWAVGDDGVIVKFDLKWPESIAAANNRSEFRQALSVNGSEETSDANRWISSLDALESEQIKLENDKSALENLSADSNVENLKFLTGEFNLTTFSTRIGVLLLLLFLVSIFISLYRYNQRMAAFNDSRADALMLMWPDDLQVSFDQLVDTFGPEKIEFAKTRSPADQALDLAKEAYKVGSRRV
ncbi:MAG: hypothetical protein ACR2O0_16020, partial [Rhizobiaceae bacterium]